MVSSETIEATSTSVEQNSSPRISFSSDFLDENNFISICPSPQLPKHQDKSSRNKDFEFLSSNGNTMLSADELFFEGKFLPFSQINNCEKLKNISLKEEQPPKPEANNVINKEEGRSVNWFLDDDPSPRPPTCTVLWKELLRLKKSRPSTLSPSSSSSSSSSVSSLVDLHAEEGKEGAGNREKNVKRVKKGLERTRSASLRVRPVINVPICTQGKNTVLPPLFPFKKGKLERSKSGDLLMKIK